MILAKFSKGRRDKQLIAFENRKKYIGIINDLYVIFFVILPTRNQMYRLNVAFYD